MVSRVLKHLLLPAWLVQRPFPPSALARIEQAVKGSERRHRGEIRFALEGPVPLARLRHSTRQRARELFGELEVWDTEENTGVLIYVQLVDHRIEIVADRGIAARVSQSAWDAICRAMEQRFRAGEFLAGALEAIEGASRVLEQHFPARDANLNELPDKPALL